MDTYDPRDLAGILFFNERDFFEAHEAWEDLWSESHGQERRFYQGLIQAAVGLFHFRTGKYPSGTIAARGCAQLGRQRCHEYGDHFISTLCF